MFNRLPFWSRIGLGKGNVRKKLYHRRNRYRGREGRERSKWPVGLVSSSPHLFPGTRNGVREGVSFPSPLLCKSRVSKMVWTVTRIKVWNGPCESGLEVGSGTRHWKKGLVPSVIPINNDHVKDIIVFTGLVVVRFDTFLKRCRRVEGVESVKYQEDS